MQELNGRSGHLCVAGSRLWFSNLGNAIEWWARQKRAGATAPVTWEFL